MATYTIELRRVCELYTRETVEQWFMNYKLEDYLLPSQIEKLNSFPNIWSKQRLATQIVDHYFMREIGFETPYLFKHYAEVTMREIMESKLPLIYTLALDYDPLINVDFTETFTRTSNENRTGKTLGENTSSQTQKGNTNGTSNSSSNSNSSGLNVSSDTPQGQINKQEILNGKYASATNASETSSSVSDETTTHSDNSNTASGTSTNTVNDTSSNDISENYTRHLTGNQGIMATYQKMIEQFRDNIISVNKDIINELNTLFMGLY